jgi:hypothetical protein
MIPEKSTGAIDTPPGGVASSNANNRWVVTDICEIVACKVPKMLIANEIGSIVEHSDLPLRIILNRWEKRQMKNTHLMPGICVSVCPR